MSTDNRCFGGTMGKHILLLFSSCGPNPRQKRWAADSLPRCGLRTREGASAGQHTCPPPVPGRRQVGTPSTSHPGGVGSGPTATSVPAGGSGHTSTSVPVGSRSGHTSTSRPCGCQVSTHIHRPSLGAAGQDTCHLPSLGAVGQDTHPPLSLGERGAPSRELHRARPEDMDAAPEGQGHWPTFFHS